MAGCCKITNKSTGGNSENYTYVYGSCTPPAGYQIASPHKKPTPKPNPKPKGKRARDTRRRKRARDTRRRKRKETTRRRKRGKRAKKTRRLKGKEEITSMNTLGTATHNVHV